MQQSRFAMWSATPTPFCEDLSIDRDSVRRLIDHHHQLGVTGLMLGGTCGEGPWMTLDDLGDLVQVAREAAAGRLEITVQVTDNSVRRVLERCETVAAAGAGIAVVSAPFLMMNATPERISGFFREIIRQSPIPVGIYDRGTAAAYALNDAMLDDLLAEPNLVMVKDSSRFNPDRAALIARIRTGKPDFRIFCGDEFTCADPLRHGFDGLLLGGAIFNARLARELMACVQTGDIAGAGAAQTRMNDLMYRVYGGPKITCWLTGLKYLLVQMGVFSTTRGHLDYPLTEECRAAIDEMVSGPDLSGFRPQISTSEVPALSV